MTRKPSLNSRIPASDLPAFKRWALPRVEGGHVVSSPFQEKRRREAAADVEELDLSGLTVEALQQLREQARQEGLAQGLEEGRAQGVAEGQALGREAGHQAAYAEAQAEIDDLKTRLRTMAQQLEAPLREQHDALEAQLLKLVGDISRAVIGGELASRPELMQDAVRRALEVLPQEGALSFSVHPDDETLVLELREREGAAWEVRADPSIARGGLVARGANSYLDYRVEPRLDEVLAQLRGDRDEAAAVQGDDPENH